MKIAVTGASGFIGTEIIRCLAKHENIEVVALSRSTHEDAQANAQQDAFTHVAEQGLCWKRTDFSQESLQGVLKGVDAVIHLAAVRGTAGSIADYHINEVMTENLLTAMGEEKVHRIVFASSIAVYSDIGKIPWRESDALKPKTLYGISKASCEYLCQYYSRKYDFAYSILRVAQVLGEGEKQKNMMKVFLDTAKEGGGLSVKGKSLARRQYIYVRDLAEVMVGMALQEGRRCETLNIGMPNAYGNLEIAKLVNSAFENQIPISYDDSLPETIEPSAMDITNLKQKWGYTPRDMAAALEDIYTRTAEK